MNGLVGCGEGVLGCKERGVSGYAVNRWGMKRPPNGTKFDGRSIGDIPRPLGKSRPIPRTFSPAHETRTERGDGRVWECRIAKRTTGKRTGCKF